jgi:hypothetical protein
MGQQQLLLLVLSTVIVGLATVAGIQAFSENQAQAQEDALVQRAINIGNDVLAAHNEPSQFGGVSLDDDDASTIAEAAGYSSDNIISADGVGDNAECTITSTGDETATVMCGSDGVATSGSSSDVNGQTVTVNVNADADEKVSVGNISS